MIVTNLANVRGDSGAGLAFQLARNDKPPTWPADDVPQQFHLDLDVPDLEQAAAYAESLGARRAERAGQEGNFIVLLDPSVGRPLPRLSLNDRSGGHVPVDRT